MQIAAKLRDQQADERPPPWFWCLPAMVGLLRTVPFIWVLAATTPAGRAYLKLGCVPNDFLSYLAFMRQVGDTGGAVFVDPFTTEPQSPRFVLLFHWLLGLVSALTGHPDWVLELSRIPLAFLFFGVLWRFLRPVLTDRTERLWACGLAAFSGGIEHFISPWAGLLPAPPSPSRFSNTPGSCSGGIPLPRSITRCGLPQ